MASPPHEPPQEPSRPSRRALLLGSIGFVVGAVIGYRCAGTQPVAAAAPVEVDELVEWVRDVARSPGRVKEMRDHYHGLLYAIEKVPSDPLIWQGFRQLVTLLDEGQTADVPAVMLARALRESLEAHHPPLDDYQDLLRRLHGLGGTRPR